MHSHLGSMASLAIGVDYVFHVRHPFPPVHQGLKPNQGSGHTLPGKSLL